MIDKRTGQEIVSPADRLSTSGHVESSAVYSTYNRRLRKIVHEECFPNVLDGFHGLSHCESIEITRYVTYYALRLRKLRGVDPEDLYHEAIKAIVECYTNRGAGSAILIAKFAMRAFVRYWIGSIQSTKIGTEEALRNIPEVEQDPMFFDDFKSVANATLNDREKQILLMWIDGLSTNRIRNNLHMKDANAVRNVIEQCARKIADFFGVDPRLESLWIGMAKALPIGVSWENGKFKARVRKDGKLNYLGAFYTAHEAEDAVLRFKSSDAARSGT